MGGVVAGNRHIGHEATIGEAIHGLIARGRKAPQYRPLTQGVGSSARLPVQRKHFRAARVSKRSGSEIAMEFCAGK